MARAVFFIAIAIAWAFPGAAQSGSDAQRILLSLRQVALVQNLTGAGCFSLTGEFDDRLGNHTIEAADTFETVLHGLEYGHEWLRLTAETDPGALQSIAGLQQAWLGLGPAIRQVVHHDLEAVAVDQIINRNAAVTDSASALAAHYLAKTGMAPRMAETIRTAAHHMMLSQRAVAELCFVYTAIGGDVMPYRLQLTLEEMDAALLAMTNGTQTVAPFPNDRIKRSYRTAALFWKKIRLVFDKAMAGEELSVDEINAVLKYNQTVLKQLGQGLEGYLAAL